MSPHFSYQRSAAAAWTRIDLLLTVYDVGIQVAQEALSALAINDGMAATRHRLKFFRVLMQVLDGLDARYETTQNIQRLALYMFDRANQGRPEDWRSILRILNILREGFSAVREQAIELEAQGVVPAVDQSVAMNLSV